MNSDDSGREPDRLSQWLRQLPLEEPDSRLRARVHALMGERSPSFWEAWLGWRPVAAMACGMLLGVLVGGITPPPVEELGEEEVRMLVFGVGESYEEGSE